MKGIILGYKKSGVQVMGKDGCFHFVRGFVDRPLGSEIEIPEIREKQGKSNLLYFTHYKQAAMIAASLIIALLLAIGQFSGYESKDVRPIAENSAQELGRLRGAYGALAAKESLNTRPVVG